MNFERYTDRAKGFVQSAQNLALREGLASEFGISTHADNASASPDQQLTAKRIRSTRLWRSRGRGSDGGAGVGAGVLVARSSGSRTGGGSLTVWPASSSGGPGGGRAAAV